MDLKYSDKSLNIVEKDINLLLIYVTDKIDSNGDDSREVKKR